MNVAVKIEVVGQDPSILAKTIHDDPSCSIYSPLVYLLGAGASKALGAPDFTECWNLMNEQFRLSDEAPTTIPDADITPLLVARKMYSEKVAKRYPKDFEKLCKVLRDQSRKRADNGVGERSLLQARACVAAEHLIRSKFFSLLDIDFSSRLRVRDWSLSDRATMPRTLLRNAAALPPTIASLYRRCFLPGGQQKIDIFTCNNDLSIESLADHWGIGVEDGFNAEGELGDTHSRESTTHSGAGIRLYKLHGSIDWRYHDHKILNAIGAKRLSKFGRTRPQNEAWNVPLIWPGVYEEKPELRAWRVALTSAVKNASCFVVAGYKLGDEKILECVEEGLSSWCDGQSRKIVLVCGSATQSKGLLRKFVAKWKRKKVNVVDTAQGFSPYGLPELPSGRFPQIIENESFRMMIDVN